MVNHVYSSLLISNRLLYLHRERNPEPQFNSWNRLNEHDVNHDSAFFLISKNPTHKEYYAPDFLLVCVSGWLIEVAKTIRISSFYYFPDSRI